MPPTRASEVKLPAVASISPSDYDKEKGIYPPFIDVIGNGKTLYKEGSKSCSRCRASTSTPSSLFFKSNHWSSRKPLSDGFCNICEDCFVEVLGITADGLKETDTFDWEKTCELLDLPVNSKKIERLLEREEVWESTDPVYIIREYTKPESKQKVRGASSIQFSSPQTLENTEEEEIVLDKETLHRLTIKWGKKPSIDLLKLEDMWADMTEAYEVKTPSQKDYIKKICNVSHELDKLLEMGDMDGVTKLSRTYDLLMKSAKLTEAQRNDTSSISSIAELAAIVESKGFIPQWEEVYEEEEKGDLVDRTIRDMQQYTERLIRECVDIDSLFKRYAGSVIEEDERREQEIVLEDEDDVTLLEKNLLKDMEQEIMREVDSFGGDD